MEVCIQPLDEQGADIIGALAGDLGYDSFIFEEPVLKCYIQSELYEPEAMRSLLDFYAASNPIRPEFSAGRMDGRKCVGVTRLMFCTPSSMSRSKISRRCADEISLPQPWREISSFWQNRQPSVQPEKNTAPLP